MIFSAQRQLTVALENQPGRLAAISQTLADNGIDIEALCVVDNVEQGVVRMLTDDPGKARDVLTGKGFYVVEAEVLTIELSSQRGRLASVTNALAKARINIDYAYVTVESKEGKSLLILKVSNIHLAEEILRNLHDDA